METHNFASQQYFIPTSSNLKQSIHDVVVKQTQTLSGTNLQHHLEAVAFLFQHFFILHRGHKSLIQDENSDEDFDQDEIRVKTNDYFFYKFLKLSYCQMKSVNQLLMNLGRPANFVSQAFVLTFHKESIMSDDALKFYHELSQKPFY